VKGDLQMPSVALLLLIVALLLFLLAAAGVPSRVNLTALGLAIWVLSQILSVWKTIP